LVLKEKLPAQRAAGAAVIVAGAQAIYMHTGEADVPLAPFTIPSPASTTRRNPASS